MSYHPHDQSNDTLGWVIALIVVLAVIVTAFVWLHRNIPGPIAADDTYQTFVMKCSMRTGVCVVDR